MNDGVTVHFVHPGNPFSPDPDGIVSVQRNFVRGAPHDFRFVYWGVRRPGVGEPQDDGRLRFVPITSSVTQRPAVPLSLKFAGRLMGARRRIERGVLRFDRWESAVPFLNTRHRKVLFLHVWDLADTAGVHSDSRWRRLGWLYGRALEAVTSRMDLVYVLGPKAVDDLARRLPSAAGKMRRFRVPVDTTLFSPVAPEVRDEARASLLRDLGIGGPARVVIFAGRLESVKRPMAIPAIAAAMASESPPVHFVVAGTGSQEAELRRSAAATAQGRVHLMGSVAPERVATLLRSADVCVLPSGFEALPNIVLESLASGTPVVASQSTGGVADLLAGRAVGRLASEAAQGFASAIREVMAWEGSRAQACREAALAFSPQAVNGDLYEDLRTLVADPVRVR